MLLRTSGIKMQNIFAATLAQLLLLQVVRVDAGCNICSAITGLACVSQVSFAVCDAGRPGNQTPFVCPNGKVCSTVGSIICQPNVTETAIACTECGTCDASHTFACTSTTEFVLCLGGDAQSDFKGSCSAGTVCSIDNPQICGNDKDPASGIAATCPTSEEEEVTEIPTTPTTTLATPSTTVGIDINNPTPYCQVIQKVGRFPVGTNPATTCRQYAQCFLHGSSWLGASYVCPGNSYFNSSSQLCGPNLPARCSSSVRSLSLAHFELN